MWRRVKQRLAKSKIILAIYILLTASILVLGYLYYFHQRVDLKKEINDDLQIIAELKVSEIQTWLHERLADAKVFAESSDLIVNFGKLLTDKNERNKYQLNKTIHLVKEQYKYQDIILIDVKGKIILTTENYFLQVGNEIAKILDKVKASVQITFSDLYWCSLCNKIHLDFITPLVVERNSSKQLLGYAILRINPECYLYPLIDNWPTNSKTAETLLARRDGDSVLFISNLRHVPNGGLKLKIPLTQINAPSVRGIFGLYGIFEGIDYRNEPVLSYTLQVPGTRWVMVSKIDTSEVYEPLRKQAWISGALLLLILSLLGFALATIRINDQKTYFKKLLQVEIERKALVRHFEYLFKYANDIIILLDKDFKIAEANDKALIVYGYSRQEMIGMDSILLRTDLSKSQVSKHLKAIDNTGFDFYEDTNVTKNGLEFPIEVSARAIDIEGVKFYQFIIRDITERKLSEQTLATSEDKFRKAFFTNPDSLTITSIDGRYISVNNGFTQIFGYDKEEVLGKTSLEIKIWQNPDERNLFIKNLKDTGIVKNFETKFYSKRREIRDCLVSATLIEFDGEPHVLSTTRNITELKQAEQLIQSTSKRLELALRSFNAGVWDWNVVTGKIEWSPKLFELFGLDPLTAIASFDTWRALLHPEDLEMAENRIGQAINNHSFLNSDYRVILQNGQICWINASGEAIYDEEGNPIQMVGICIDITARKEAEEKILNQLEELQRWQKVTLKREDRNIELKREVNELLMRLNEPIRYPSQEIKSLDDQLSVTN